MSKEAMKLALDALEVATTPLANDRQEVLRAQAALREALAEHPAQGCEYCNHPLYAGTKCKNCGRVTEQAAIKQDLTPEQPAQQEPVSCPVCNQVHTILDADESQIIRNAKDGYPDGRTPRLLTLQERVAALCQYASDWKRWCLEKENTTPQAQPAQQEPVAWRDPTNANPGQGCTYIKARAERSPHIYKQALYTSPPAQRTWVEVEQVKWEGNKLIAKLKEKNT